MLVFDTADESEARLDASAVYAGLGEEKWAGIAAVSHATFANPRVFAAPHEAPNVLVLDTGSNVTKSARADSHHSR